MNSEEEFLPKEKQLWRYMNIHSDMGWGGLYSDTKVIGFVIIYCM